MDTINEQTTYRITITWTDEAGEPLTPTSGTYRIDDVTDPANPVTVKTTQTITPSSSSANIDIAYGDNAILNSANAYENRLVTFTWTYGGNKKGTGEYRYRIKNLLKIP